MTDIMTYKGYSARIGYDDEDGIFTGRIAGIRDGVGFHADNVNALREAFHEAVEDYLETCARIGKKPRKPYSGRMMFRVNSRARTSTRPYRNATAPSSPRPSESFRQSHRAKRVSAAASPSPTPTTCGSE